MIIVCCASYISLIRTFGALMPGHGETITDEEIWERLPVRIQSTLCTCCSLTFQLCWLVCLPLNRINRTYKLSNISCKLLTRNVVKMLPFPTSDMSVLVLVLSSKYIFVAKVSHMAFLGGT
jgi:hypothetical protein